MLSSIFTHPWLLAGLAAVAIPLIIELLFRLHRRRVELPTIRWLLKHKDQKKIKRQNRLLIIIRSLVIFFLVLAIARPLIGKTFFGGARKRNVVVLLDTTTSMGRQSGVGTALEVARQRAEMLIRGLSEGTTVAVAVVADRLRVVLEPTQNRLAAADAVRGIRPRGGAAPISDGLQWAEGLLATHEDVKNEVYIFSDFQVSSWTHGAPTATLLNALAQRAEVFLIDVAPPRAVNVVVTSFQPTEPIASVGVAVDFEAALTAYAFGPTGDEEEAGPVDITVTFLVDGQKKDVVRQSFDFGAGRAGEEGSRVQRRRVTFSHTFDAPREYLVSVEISGDENPLDNRRDYLIDVPRAHKVLIFDPSAPLVGVGRDLDEQMKRQLKSYFLQQAIEPQQPPGYDPVTHFVAVVRHPNEAERENLGQYAAVCLVGLPDPPEQLVTNCEVYVRDGGALLIFLDETVNIFEYGRKLSKGGRGLLPVALSSPQAPVAVPAGGAETDTPGAVGTADEGQVVLALSHSSHPALALFSEAANPVPARVHRHMPLAVEESAADEVRTMATFSNGAPAIIERSFGAGKVCLFNLTVDGRWTDLVAITQFLPLMQEILRYLVGNPDRAVNLEVGGEFRSRVLRTSQHLLLKAPDGEGIRLTPQLPAAVGGPTTRAAAEEASDAAPGATAWEVTFRPQQQGVYTIEAPHGEVPRKKFVANLPAIEGDPQRFSRAGVQRAFSGVPFQWIALEQSMAELVARRYAALEAAAMLLALVAGLLAVESLLAALFGRRRGAALIVSGRQSVVRK